MYLKESKVFFFFNKKKRDTKKEEANKEGRLFFIVEVVIVDHGAHVPEGVVFGFIRDGIIVGPVDEAHPGVEKAVKEDVAAGDGGSQETAADVVRSRP